jgi:branched-chain amino acid transport system substrate-binding protein
MKLDRRSWVAAGAATALLAAVGVARADDKPTVKIAAIVPISGAGAFDGQLGLEGMKAMAEVINAKGGVLDGRKIELVVYDDKGTPEEGVSAAKRAIEQDHVDAIVGGWFSAVALSMKEATRDKVLTVFTSSQHPDVTAKGHKWSFRLNATSTMMAAKYSDFICKTLKPKSIAFITINDDYGRLEVDNYKRLLGACGVEVKGNEFYNRDDTDFSTALTKLKSLSPDAIYVSAINTSQGATIYRQIKQTGFKGLTIASAGNMNPKLVELSGPSLNNVYSVSLYAPDADNPILKSWTTQYAKLFTNEPAFIGTLGAQAVELIAEAMDKAGTSTDDDKIAETLKGQTWPTLLGDVKFDANGQALQSIYLIQVVKGKIVGATGG